MATVPKYDVFGVQRDHLMFHAVQSLISVTHLRKPETLKFICIFKGVLLIENDILEYRWIMNKESTDLRLCGTARNP